MNQAMTALAVALALHNCAGSSAEPSGKKTKASYYSRGQAVACRGYGRFDPEGMTAAHRTLPCGTRVEVSRGDKSVLVTITDRGPFVRGRDIDLSRAAARRLGMLGAGVAPVKYRVVSGQKSKAQPAAEPSPFEVRFKGCDIRNDETCR